MRHYVALFVVLLCIVSSVLSSCLPGTPRTPRTPVIFIPGLAGNRIDARFNESSTVRAPCDTISADYANVWINIAWIFSIQCLADVLKLDYDNVTHTTRSPDGIDVKIPGWGDPTVIEKLISGWSFGFGWNFKHIADMLIGDLGYVRNVSLRGAPYDFRKGPDESDEYFLKLKELIEETYTQNGDKPVTLIAHSMGGLMAVIFLQRQNQTWKNQYISSLVTLGGAWGGSVESLKMLALGTGLGYELILRPNIMKHLVATFPSVFWLLPWKSFWQENEVLVQSETMNYTVLDLDQYLTDIGVPNAREFRKNMEKYQLDYRAPGVRVHCLYSDGINTPEGLYYEPGQAISDYPTRIMGDGDGTVNIRSLEGCRRWQDHQEQQVNYRSFANVEHWEIVKNHDVIAYLGSILNDSNVCEVTETL